MVSVMPIASFPGRSPWGMVVVVEASTIARLVVVVGSGTGVTTATVVVVAPTGEMSAASGPVVEQLTMMSEIHMYERARYLTRR